MTVVIPAYNRAATIERAIRSAQSQVPEPPVEILVVDDASSDDTAQIAESLGVRLLRHGTNMGAATARNTAINAASGEWVAFLDSDDEWLPHHLATLWPLREGRSVVAASVLVVGPGDEPRRLIGAPTSQGHPLTSPRDVVWPENPVPACASMMPTDLVRSVGGLRTHLGFAEDFDLLIRVLERAPGFVSPDVTALYHFHPSGKSRNQQAAFDTQEGIVETYRGRSWHGRALEERRRGLRNWDRLRTALAEHERARATRLAFALGIRPNRLIGLFGGLRWRRQMRARFSDEAGRIASRAAAQSENGSG